MKKQKISREKLEADLKYLKKGKIAESVTSTISNIAKWLGIFGISIYVYKSLAVLSGKDTNANLNFAAILTTPEAPLIPWAIAILGLIALISSMIYGVSQKKLRQDNIAQLEGRIKDLEKMLDSKRTSSGLTQRGQTRPEDRQ